MIIDTLLSEPFNAINKNAAEYGNAVEQQPIWTSSPHKPGAEERAQQSEQNWRDADAERLVSEGSLLKTVTASDLLKMDVPIPEVMLAPWLRRGTLAMIVAQAGVGKTWTALSIADALSTGGSVFNGLWNAPQPRKVLYIDGEMSLSDMQRRIGLLGTDNDNFRLCNPDLDRENKCLNIASSDCQKQIEETISRYNIDVVVIDNVASLYRVDVNSNNSESWMIMQDFLWKLRRKDIGVIVVDHRGKNEGETARGTSAKSDILDIAITLKRPEEAKESDGAQFVVKFTKSRGLYGKDVRPFLATFSNGTWETTPYKEERKQGRPAKENNREKVITLFEDGVTSPQKITEESGVPIASVKRYLKDYRTGFADNDGYHVVTNGNDYSEC